MNNKFLVFTALAFTSCASFDPSPPERLSFVVSLEDPADRLCHVEFHCDGLKGGTHDFTMPAWTPGYYRIMNYAKNVTNFTARDAAGRALEWVRTDSNTWRVQSGGAPALTVSYDVITGQAIFQTSLGKASAFIAPTGTYMNLDGQIARPVTVTLKPRPGWSNIATGLDPVPGRSNTFSAPDFDILYDCPTLLGKLEVLPFAVRGVHHEFDGLNLGDFDRANFVSDLKRMVQSATALMGDVPYKHYTFIVSGRGGGIEHLDETTLPFTSADLSSPLRNKRWLSFVAHEYFHNFNVKRIRPIVLGPFDYEHENRTRMLWLSEGCTVYYEWIVLRRAGLLDVEDVLNGSGGDRGFRGLSQTIAAFENSPGHLYQSAAEASWNTWDQPSFGGSNPAGPRLTISYYDKGAVLGALLDLKIRHQSQNKKSLDDVMRGLYKEYYQEKKCGFTDLEFRQMCERMAGVPLDEEFDYVFTTRPVNYPKYFDYAGLDIVMPEPLPGAAFGAFTRQNNGQLLLTAVEPVSSAAQAGLLPQDEILTADGLPVNDTSFNQVLDSKKPGDAVEIVYSRAGARHTARILLARKTGVSTFAITPQPHPNPLQAAILKDWLRGP
ncbi:MAG: PDZ domain-containing protein [Verrucomicrobiota bacterium]|jgi:predicted metalloprotease with PDZ domain